MEGTSPQEGRPLPDHFYEVPRSRRRGDLRHSPQVQKHLPLARANASNGSPARPTSTRRTSAASSMPSSPKARPGPWSFFHPQGIYRFAPQESQEVGVEPQENQALGVMSSSAPPL